MDRQLASCTSIKSYETIRTTLKETSVTDGSLREGRRRGRRRRTELMHKKASISIVSITLILIDLIMYRAQPIRAAPTSTTTISTSEPAHLLQHDQTRLNNHQQTGQATSNLETNALSYLQKYGYMSSSLAHLSESGEATNNNLISEESFSSAISDFQRFAGIPATGLIDNQTLQFMRMPRCGNSDKSQAQQQQLELANHHHHLSGGGGARPSALELPRQPKGVVISKSGQLTQSRQRFLHNTLRRRKRYALQGSKWRRQQLSYRISQYPTRFNGRRHEVDGQIEKAFGIWSQVAPIDFVVKRDGRVHIDIRFASGDHGDGDAFDGPGNTLAHAYFPQYGGDAHFDDQEYWTVDSYAGTNIFQVAAHELGHSLGLGHSNVREALMAPFYQKYKPNFKLHMDDVLAIQALYGEKPYLADPPSISPAAATTTTTTTSTTTTPAPTSSTARPAARYPSIYKGLKPAYGGDRRPSFTTTTTTSSGFDGREVNDNDNDNGKNGPDLSGNGLDDQDPSSSSSSSGGDSSGGLFPNPNQVPTSGSSYPADLCSDSSIDAISRTEDGSSYVFKGDYYWLLTQDGLARGYPRKIAADWEGLPGQLDAALTWADGKTFFFKGNKYWRFRNKRRDVGYPKLISAGFAGIPDDIDAAFVWSGNGRTYIFKGDDYWRFDSKAEPPVSSEYPRPIKVWSGVPGDIDAAFKWENNVTYFFKGNQYYRFNDKDFKVESRGRPAFPRQTSEWWFGCVNSNLAQRAASSSSSSSSLSSGSLRDFRPSELVAANNNLHQPPAQAQQAPNGDEWSFLAGLEDNTRLLGTHISDQKPPSDVSDKESESKTEPREASFHDQMGDSDSTRVYVSPPTITKRSSTVNGFRFGLFDSIGSSSAAAPSASSFHIAIFLSSAQIYYLTFMLSILSLGLNSILTSTTLIKS